MVVQISLTLVSTVTVGSGGAASIEFTNIPQTGKDLLVLISGRSARAGEFGRADNYLIQLNNDTANNYTYRRLIGNGSTASSGSGTVNGFLNTLPASLATANTFGNTSLYIANYTSSVAKSTSLDGVDESNATAAYAELYAQTWSGTSAVTSIKILTLNNQNLVQHSSASLYIIS